MPGGDLKNGQREGSSPRPLYAAEAGHLHDALGVIYRDLKPENILLDGTATRAYRLWPRRPTGVDERGGGRRRRRRPVWTSFWALSTWRPR